MLAQSRGKSSFLLESDCSNHKSESQKYVVELPLTWRPGSPHVGGAIQSAAVLVTTVPLSPLSEHSFSCEVYCAFLCVGIKAKCVGNWSPRSSRPVLHKLKCII